MQKVDVLAFGAHQDDVEVGIGGLILNLVYHGYKVGIVSLTRNDMNSRASTETIAKEAEKAANKLGVEVREVLDLGDSDISESRENAITVANCIRKYKPSVVLSPYPFDLHNDHNATGKIVQNSNLFCRLKKLESPFDPHGPSLFLHYFLQLKSTVQPTVIVDTTRFFDKKIEALRSYESQFDKNASEAGILTVGISDFLFHMESRDRFYGSLINTKFGEPLYSVTPIRLTDLGTLLE